MKKALRERTIGAFLKNASGMQRRHFAQSQTHNFDTINVSCEG